MLVAALCACSGTGRDIPPPLDSLHYPTGIAVDPAGDFLYVVSTNFDSRYTGGTIVPLDVARMALVPEGAVEVGSFAGDLSVGKAGEGALGFLAIRNDSYLTRLELARVAGVPVLSCGPRPATGNATCDAAHVLATEDLYHKPDGTDQTARDPFAVALGAPWPGQPRPVYLGTLLDGVLQLFTLGDDGIPAYDSGVLLAPGIHSIVERSRVDGSRVVYASNRMANRLDVIDLSVDLDGAYRLQARDPFVLPQASAIGDYFRGLALSGSGATLFAAFRSPAGVAVLDITADGGLAYRGLVPLDGSPSQVAVYSPGGLVSEELVYVTDFSGDAVYVVDPRTLGVAARISVGNGPYGIAVAGDRAWVTDFEEHAVSVIPLDPASPDRHREVARLK